MNYHFDARPENSWVLFFPRKEKQIWGRGSPLTDKHFCRYLKELGVYKIVKQMIKRYKITGEPVLVAGEKDGCQFIKGDVAYLTDQISALLQELVDSYCEK